MSHLMRVPIFVVAVLAFVACGGNPSWQQQKSTNHPRKNVTVQFTDATLHPSSAQITSDGNVIWINYSNEKVGTIFFDASVRDAFACDMRPLFMDVAGGYQSIPIGGSTENVTLPCTPMPGEYEYQLQLSEGSAGEPVGGTSNPLSVMRGTIKVVP